jgi:hypothetical protein
MRCRECEIDVEPNAVRCPRCLRISTLTGDEIASAQADSPNRKRSRALVAIAGVVAVALVRESLYADDLLLTDWLSVPDLIVTLVALVAVGYVVVRARLEGRRPVKAAHPLVAALIVSALVPVMLAATVDFAWDPLRVSSGGASHLSLHQWAWALGSLVIAGFAAYASWLFWRELLQQWRRR